MHGANRNCGADRTRTDDFLLAKQVLYQLSYRPREVKKTTVENSGSRLPHTSVTVRESS